MKDKRNIQSEYGLTLHWINGGGDEGGSTWPYKFYLENSDMVQIPITNKEALDYIAKVTTNAFRHDANVYDHYVTLFDILGIKPRRTFGDLVLSKGFSGRGFAKEAELNQQTINRLMTGERNIMKTEFETIAKIAFALNMTIDELWRAIK